jgi:hypothetical protein
VTLAHPVAYGNGVELLCNATPFGNGLLDTFPQAAEMDVSGDYFVPGVDDRNQGSFEILLFHACGIEECPVAGAFEAVGDLSAAIGFQELSPLSPFDEQSIQSFAFAVVLNLDSEVG